MKEDIFMFKVQKMKYGEQILVMKKKLIISLIWKKKKKKSLLRANLIINNKLKYYQKKKIWRIYKKINKRISLNNIEIYNRKSKVINN